MEALWHVAACACLTSLLACGQDKQTLTRANEELARENAQLHELLGYLTRGMHDNEPEWPQA